MTIKKLNEKLERIEKKVTANSLAITGMIDGRRALVEEWKVYEDEYKKYIIKRDRFRKSLWRLFCKVTFRSIKLTEKELNKRIAKKMARVFYKGDRR